MEMFSKADGREFVILQQKEVDQTWATIRPRIDRFQAGLVSPEAVRRLIRDLCVIAVSVYYNAPKAVGRMHRLCEVINWPEAGEEEGEEEEARGR